MTTDLVTSALRGLAVVAVGAAVGLTVAPNAVADPDPHIPNGAAGWCLGGRDPATYCLGEAFPDGTFLAQSRFLIASQPFRGPQWQHYALCMTWIDGQRAAAPGCGGVASIGI